jgi:hypothetical protein
VNRLLGIILVLSISLPFITKVGVVSNYFFNYDYYSEVLCENKEVPEMNCNGSCQLSKELNSVSSSTDSNPDRNVERLQIELSIILNSSFLFIVNAEFFDNESGLTITSDDLYISEFVSQLIKPPIFFV